MRRTILLVSLLFVAACVTGSALAQELVVYPSKGQSKEQMERDKYECYQWAKQQTGFDPMQGRRPQRHPPLKSLHEEEFCVEPLGAQRSGPWLEKSRTTMRARERPLELLAGQ